MCCNQKLQSCQFLEAPRKITLNLSFVPSQAVAVTVAGDKYDFELKAEPSAAWVGVGLSEDDKMGDDSVIECVKRGNGVAAYMSYTKGSPNYGAPRLANVSVDRVFSFGLFSFQN